jgi:hypothetical protein
MNDWLPWSAGEAALGASFLLRPLPAVLLLLLELPV